MEINKYTNITLREAIKELVENHDMKYLTSLFILGLNGDTALTDEKFKVAVSNISKLIQSLIDLPYKDIGCVIALDVYVDDTDKMSLGNDVYYTLPNDTEKYALDFLDWANVIDARIDVKSIAHHGLLNVVIATLIELSFYGYDYKTAMKGLQETKDYLDTIY